MSGYHVRCLACAPVYGIIEAWSREQENRLINMRLLYRAVTFRREPV
jgi:hypothetical protein